MAVDNSVGQIHARAAAAGDADRIHAAAEEQAAGLRGLAEHEHAVRREAFRTVEQHPDLCGFQRRQPVQRVLHHRLEMVPVLGQEAEFERLVQHSGRDRLAHRLETADQQAAAVVADVEMAVMVRQGRQVAGDAFDRPGQQVEMLAGEQWHPGAGHGADLARPQPGAQCNGIAHDDALPGLDAADAAVLRQDAGDAGVLEELCAEPARRLAEGRADIRRADPSVFGRPDRAEHIVGVHQRPAFLRLAGADLMRLDPVSMGERRLAPDMGQAVRRRGDRQGALLDPADALPGFRFELRIEFHRILDHPREIARMAQRPDLGGRMPGRSRSQPVALQQDGVGHAHLRQMVERRAAHDATADDNDRSMRGKRFGHGRFLGSRPRRQGRSR